MTQVEPSPDELFFGIVRAVGTDTTAVIGELHALLHSAGYHVEDIQLGSFLDGKRPLEERIHRPKANRHFLGSRTRSRSDIQIPANCHLHRLFQPDATPSSVLFPSL
jgi:hypothetical protein